MALRTFILSTLLAFTLQSAVSTRAAIAFPLDNTRSSLHVDRISFGSCNQQTEPQPLWAKILEDKPQLYVGLGDNIYADTHDPEVLAKEYEKQFYHPDYVPFREAMPIIATWDDHDYGLNNEGKENPIKAQSQKLFLNFFEEPANSPRWQQKGVYTSYVVGSPGAQIKVILLDLRYFRDRPNVPTDDLLGKAQWKWLKAQLQGSTAQVHLIGSSSSVLSKNLPGGEEWRDYVSARRKLFKLLDSTKPSGVIFLTGDRHFAGFLHDHHGDKTYYELMSSGLTKQFPKWADWVMKIIYGHGNTAFGHNYANLDFHWDRAPLELTFQARGANGDLPLRKRFRLINRMWTLIKD